MNKNGQNDKQGIAMRKFNPTTPEEYLPMEVPEHIYVAGVERRPTNKEVPPEMIVPSRITVGAGETTLAAKAQPTEVLRERQSLLPNTNDDGININGIPTMLTANELPSGDFANDQNQSGIAKTPDPENQQHYSSQTSIVVDENPLYEIKQIRRRLNMLTKRVQCLEMNDCNYQNDRPYIIGAGCVLLGGILTIMFLHIVQSGRR